MIELSDVGGLRVLTEPVPFFHSVALGVICGQGSRDEPASDLGITHVVEHMLFKGTERKTAGQISRTIESVGGMLNGFTNKEATGIYARFMVEHFDVAVDLLLEMLNESRFGADELAREREVVFEEIKSSQEDPEDECVDEMFRAYFGEHPLGPPVSGELSTVGSLDDAKLRRYYEGSYARDRVVVSAVGEIDHEQVQRRFDEGLKVRAKSVTPPRRAPIPATPGIRVRERREITQVHICVAKPAIPFPDERRVALGLLNAAFGASTSSRLFQRLREEEGLVYSVSSFAELFSDSGLFGVFLTTDKKKLGQALKSLREEWNRLADSNLEAAELETARNFAKGGLTLSMESLTGRMMRMAHSQLLLNRQSTLEERLAELDAASLSEVGSMVKTLGRFEDFYVSAVGPIDERELRQLL